MQKKELHSRMKSWHDMYSVHQGEKLDVRLRSRTEQKAGSQLCNHLWFVQRSSRRYTEATTTLQQKKSKNKKSLRDTCFHRAERSGRRIKKEGGPHD
jgi:hypothetical protein